MNDLRSAKLIALGILAILLVACSPISRGTITNKEYTAPYTIPVSYCAMYNSKGICTMYGTRYDHYPARWKFNLNLEEENGWVYVNEHTYNEYEIGDFYGAEGKN